MLPITHGSDPVSLPISGDPIGHSKVTNKPVAALALMELSVWWEETTRLRSKLTTAVTTGQRLEWHKVRLN